MKDLFRKVFYRFLFPFKENIVFLLTISLLISVPRLFYYIYYSGDLAKGIWEAAHCYILCYFVGVFCSFIPNNWKYVYRLVFYVLAFFDFCSEAACIIVTKSHFNDDYMAIILATNIAESKEFIETYITLDLFFVVVSAIVVIILLHLKKDVLNKFGDRIALLSTFVTLFSVVYFVAKGSESWGGKFYTKMISFAKYETPPDLRQYEKPIEIIRADSSTLPPECIVLILGESFSKSHSSLYGYNKNTNPNLAKLVEDSLLFVVDDVSAPALTTIPCVKSIMSSYKQEYGDSVKWYECETLPGIMSQLGYKTTWISNQSPSGVYDNIAARYSELCDESYFIGSKVKGVGKTNVDGEILDLLSAGKITSSSRDFIIVHLMGSHYTFSDRYPKEFEKFISDDYLDLKENQRKIISAYDNSVLYNDFVVSEILKFFAERETLAFYFSDHGLDLYDSSDDYFGHAIANDPVSSVVGRQVPFVVYMSSKYQMKYPSKKNYLLHNKDSWNKSENIMQYLCELLDIRYISKYK